MNVLEALKLVISTAERGAEMMEVINGMDSMYKEQDAIQIMKLVVDFELLHHEADEIIGKELEA